MKRIIRSSRYLIVIPIIGSLIGSLVLLVFGLVQAIQIAIGFLPIIGDTKGVKYLATSMIEVMDVFLLGTAFYIIYIGLYELFIDDQLNLPDWLSIHNFEDLKGILLGVIIVLISVMFLSVLVSWDGEQNLIGVGVSVALVIASLTYYLSLKKREKQ